MIKIYCDICKKEISEYFSIELSGRKSVWRHLEVCNSCYNKVSEIIKSLSLIKEAK